MFQLTGRSEPQKTTLGLSSLLQGSERVSHCGLVLTSCFGLSVRGLQVRWAAADNIQLLQCNDFQGLGNSQRL